MKLEAMSCKILRYVIGTVLILHALYNVISFDAYTLEVDHYLKRASLSEHLSLSWAVALFPFLEFTLGALLVFKLFYSKTIVWTVIVFSMTAVMLFTFNKEPLAGAALFVSCSCLYIYLRKADAIGHNKRMTRF